MEESRDVDFDEISKANYKKLSTALTKAGYKDGIVEGREAVFQHGFDIGYSDGLRTAFEIAKWKTVLKLDAETNSKDEGPVKHPILESPEGDHHKFIQNPQQSVAEATSMQNEYVEKLQSNLKNDLKELNHYFD